jgi:hypothetical protein
MALIIAESLIGMLLVAAAAILVLLPALLSGRLGE